MNHFINDLINTTLNSHVGRITWAVLTVIVGLACVYFAADPATIESLRSKL